jgi:16S rRNA (cytosine1402-N4)-methyltransferase
VADGSAHRPIMADEVLRVLDPRPGDIAVDCTLGGGGHAEAILQRITPGGRLIGLDVDPIELPRTEARLRAGGFGPDVFEAHRANFGTLPEVLASTGVSAANVIVADLGTSSMQTDTAARGFNYKRPGPLDMRMDPTGGSTAAELVAQLRESELAALLRQYADEPHAAIVAGLLKKTAIATTHAAERSVRTGLSAALPELSKSEIKMSVRRTFQALRIAVNGELAALDALLAALPRCLAPAGRAAIITFHSGEDRPVKKAFAIGHRVGIYSAISKQVVRSTKEETFTNRRAQPAKLRWAIRAGQPAASQ